MVNPAGPNRSGRALPAQPHAAPIVVDLERGVLALLNRAADFDAGQRAARKLAIEFHAGALESAPRQRE